MTVRFDRHGRVSDIEGSPHYGVAGNIYSNSGNWTYPQSAKLCDSVTSTRNFFPAPDGEAALEVAAYVDAIHHRGPFAKQNYSYSCNGECGNKRFVLNFLKLGKIDWVRSIDCPNLHLKYPSCYAIHAVFGTYRVYGSYTNRVIVKAVHVERIIPVP